MYIIVEAHQLSSDQHLRISAGFKV